MTLSPANKSFLLNALKNAINASLTAVGPIAAWPEQFHFHDWRGVEHILTVMGSAALARELMVYGPKLLAWSANTTEEK
jgi:hypothetical protein